MDVHALPLQLHGPLPQAQCLVAGRRPVMASYDQDAAFSTHGLIVFAVLLTMAVRGTS